MELEAGSDFREKRYRREVFQRFYSFHLKHRSHPGGVYYALPAMADAGNWDGEQRAWAAFLNGNTQNPVTTWLLMQAGSSPAKADDVLSFWRENYDLLSWDTDRRYHKSRLDQSFYGYLKLTEGGQCTYWGKPRDWYEAWKAANDIPTMGRLSAWSYLEYLRILKVADLPDSETLMLSDRSGSRSHRNGLCLVTGRDDWMWWDRNPGFNGTYPRDVLRELEEEGVSLVAEARKRNPGNPDVGYLTLESALCTYKSWHRPNRRYPGVYNDLLYDRLKNAEARFGPRFDVLWQARKDSLPEWMRLEDNPYDPGCVPGKQNWYLRTGEVIGMEKEWPCFVNGFSRAVESRAFGIRPR